MMKNIDHSSVSNSGTPTGMKMVIPDLKIPEIKIPPIHVPEAVVNLTVQPAPVKVEPIVQNHNVVVNPKLTLEWNKLIMVFALSTLINCICAIILKLIK